MQQAVNLISRHSPVALRTRFAPLGGEHPLLQMMLQPSQVFLQAFKANEQIRIRYHGWSSVSDNLLLLGIDDTADRLESGRANAWGRRPLLVRDLGNVPEARTASIELAQKRVSHSRVNGFKRKRLIQIHRSIHNLTGGLPIATSRSRLIQGNTWTDFCFHCR